MRRQKLVRRFGLPAVIAALMAVYGTAWAANPVGPAAAEAGIVEENIGASAPRRAANTPPATAPAAVNTSAAPVTSVPAASRSSSFSYTVRPGDTLGAIAALFGLNVDNLAAANRMTTDAGLRVGQVLRVPNPFAAQVRDLQTQIDTLQHKAAAASDSADNAVLQMREMKNHMARLTSENAGLHHALATLPWWRGATVTVAIAALLMLGVTLLALLEWWSMRRKFGELVDMNDALRRLDYKYKSVLSKAELRFQQLYGRRRAGMPEPGDSHVKIPEEIEIERLDRELKAVLEAHLERLTGTRGRRRADEIGSVGEPAHARYRR